MEASPLKPDVLLVAYSEVALKSAPVRRRLEAMLLSHVRGMLAKHGVKAGRSWKEGGRILLEVEDGLEAAKHAAQVFGVEYAAAAVKAGFEPASMAEAALSLLEGRMREGLTFAVRGRRSKIHPYTSRQLEAALGEAVLKRFGGLGVKVDLEAPQLELHVEAREKASYVYVDVFRGPGGLPLGSQGAAVAVLDSPQAAAAAWFAMRRGVKVTPLTVAFEVESLNGLRRLAEALSKWAFKPKLKAYQLALNGTAEKLKLVKAAEARWMLGELAKAAAAARLAQQLKVETLVSGLTLQPSPEAALQLLAALRRMNMLVLTPLLGLEEAEALKAFERLGLAWEKPKPVRPADTGEVEKLWEKLSLEEAVQRDMENLSRVEV